VPAPVLRYDRVRLNLRERRMLGLPYGGTVAIHFLKRNEWFLETALAILGRDRTWDRGIDAPAFAPRPLVAAPASSSSLDQDDSPAAVDELSVSNVPQWEGVGVIHALEDRWGGARMWGSPIVREDGYIVEGRARPVLVEEAIPGRLGRYTGRPKLGFANPEEGVRLPKQQPQSSSSSSSEVSSTATSSSAAPSLPVASSPVQGEDDEATRSTSEKAEETASPTRSSEDSPALSAGTSLTLSSSASSSDSL
jgi:microcystin-dependent protein